MISPRAVLSALPYMGAIVTAILLFMSFQTAGLTIGSLMAWILLGFGSVACTILSRPWCKLGAGAIAFALIIAVDLVAGIPVILTGGFIVLFWWAR